MKVRYDGPHDVLLMHAGNVWEVHPGDVMDLPEVPNLPGWSDAKQSANSTKEGEK